MDHERSHICVCICTYKRPRLLAHLLNALQDQVTEQMFTYSIVVVDNDFAQSAKDIVESFKANTLIDIDYYIEPEQNIALARNKAIENAKGNFIAIIDDDEFPEKDWLLNFYKAHNNYNADGFFGPVKPYFEEKPPDWLIKGKFCERLSHKTGTVLKSTSCRTGNAFLNRNIFQGKDDRFDMVYGRTGGEDGRFFLKKIREGRVFLWCNEAVVNEIVPPERWKKSYYIKRNMRIGGLSGEQLRKGPFWVYGYNIKIVVAFVLFTVILPFSFLFGQHVYMRCLTKIVYNFGWLSGFCGHMMVKYKDE